MAARIDWGRHPSAREPKWGPRHIARDVVAPLDGAVGRWTRESAIGQTPIPVPQGRVATVTEQPRDDPAGPPPIPVPVRAALPVRVLPSAGTPVEPLSDGDTAALAGDNPPANPAGRNPTLRHRDGTKAAMLTRRSPTGKIRSHPRLVMRFCPRTPVTRRATDDGAHSLPVPEVPKRPKARGRVTGPWACAATQSLRSY